MRVLSFSTSADEPTISITLGIGATPPAKAMTALLGALALLEGAPVPQANPVPQAGAEPVREDEKEVAQPSPAPAAPVAPAPAARTRQRRPAEPAPELATEVAQAEAQAVPETPRRRRGAEDGGISDADLSKACSNGAAAIEAAEARINMPEGGGAKIVMAILKDFGVGKAYDLPVDKRQQFLDELAEEVAQAEALAEARK